MLGGSGFSWFRVVTLLCARTFLFVMSWFVYLLLCRDSSVYTGITTDVDRRMSEHEKGVGSKYVASKGFWKLLFVIRCSCRSEASKVEYAVKQLSRDEKFRFFREHEDKVFDVFVE